MSLLRIYASKENTIAGNFDGSGNTTGFELLNSARQPIYNLWYGGGGGDSAIRKRHSVSRHLIQFDLSELQSKIATSEINSANTITYQLKFKNCIPSDEILQPEFEYDTLNKSVASGFDLVFFPIPTAWDQGRGYDLEETNFILKRQADLTLTGTSNWLSATTQISWSAPGIFEDITASTSTYATQHFDVGNEDIDVDVSSMVRGWLSGDTNNGIGIAYSKYFESLSTDTRSISSFFSNNTNSSFKPSLDVIYNQQIIREDRHQVTNNRVSRLFLYTFSGNTPTNYFSASTVVINNSAGQTLSAITPTRLSKGTYFVDIFLPGATKGQKYKDIWSGVTFVSGIDKTNFTQTFEIRDNFYTNNAKRENSYTITTFGLDNGSTLIPGEVIRIYADTRINYSTELPFVDYGLEYRLDMSTNNEVIPWTSFNSAIIDNRLTSFFDLDTSWLLNSQIYKISFRIAELGTKRVIPETITFKVLKDTGKPNL